MSWLEGLLSRRRLVLALVALLVLVGLAAWTTMPRQEDPTFRSRIATLVVTWPGADPERMERLVVRPIEDALADVPELEQIRVTARSGGAGFLLELRGTISETDPVWDSVRDALADVAARLPAGVRRVDLDTKQGEPATRVLLVTGSADPLALRRGARELEDALLEVPGVARVQRVGDPGEQIRVRLDPAMADRLDLDPQTLAGVLRARNTVTPGGAVVVDGRRAALVPSGELLDVDAFRATPWVLPDGSAVPLGEIATITLGPREPATERVHHDGGPAIAVSVIPELPQDLVDLGARLDARVQQLAPRLAERGLSIETFSSQADHVAERLGSLTRTLLVSIAVVAGTLLLAMGLRLGVVVASVVPLVTLSTVAVYAMGGGVLHQISVSAMVLALGLIVDNAIVVSETVQRHIDDGIPPAEAARRALRQLGVPLGTATGTTIAAFVPMLLARGVTADFTRAIPVVMIIALVLSYVYALAVTPALASWLQRPARPGRGRDLDALSIRLGERVVRSPGTSALTVGAVMLATLLLLPFVSREFFPMSDRPRLLATVELAEGAPLSETERVVAVLENALAQEPSVTHLTSFVGHTVPRFYYNLTFPPAGPHRATLVVTARRADDVPALAEVVRRASRAVPEASVVPRRLQQGPPAAAPIEVRLTGEDLGDLQIAAEAVMARLRAHPATRDVRHDLGIGTPSLGWTIDDASAGRRGLTRRDVALSLLGRTQGLPAGEVRSGRDPVPVVVTTPDGEHTSPGELVMATIGAPGATSAPVAAMANHDLSWGPGSIERRDRRRIVTVSAQLAPGTTFSDVADDPGAFAEGLPSSVQVTLGGESEESSEANGALLAAVPIGLGLLMGFLLLEFDSLRRIGIVLATVPLAAVGVVPGLALSGQPFGFMSLLGVLSLVGIVVNNAIVLIDVIERERATGTAAAAAVIEAIRLRTRPILLTTGTTVAGMLPLALSDSPLWPPLAWAIISGLVASTALTLVAVPSLYQLLCGSAAPRWLRRSALGLAVGAGLLVVGPARAEPVTLSEALATSVGAPAPEAAERAADAARSEARAATWAAVGPAVGAEASAWRRDDPLQIAFDVPEGPTLAITQQPDRLVSLGAEARLPVLDAPAIARIRPARQSARASRATAERAAHVAALQAAEAWLDVRVLDARRDATAAYVASVQAVHADLQARHGASLVVESDVLRAEVARLDAEQQLRALDRQRGVATRRLGAALGRSEPAEPTGPLPEPGGPTPATRRRDLEAAEAQVAARRGERGAVLADALPTIEVYAGYRYLDQANLVDNDWLEAGIRARWTPIARGARPGRHRALGQRVAEAEARQEQLRLAIEVEQAAADAAVDVARAEVEVRSRAVAQATLAAEQVSDRYRQGLATWTELLEVQAELRQQRTRYEVARIESLRAALRRQVALGAPPSLAERAPGP